MPSWNQILQDIVDKSNTIDSTRRKYIKELSDYTGRNTIVYYSAFLQKSALAKQGVDFGINDADKNGFMAAICGMEKSKGLDLVLHTPGGLLSAAESIVIYLKSVFGNNIRAIVPQIAMSAGTMMALSTKEIVMGKHSNLGPIDPQLNGLAAHAIIEEFDTARKEILNNPQSAHLWRPILEKYHPTYIGECAKSITWANTIVVNWLKDNMFSTSPESEKKAKKVVSELGSHSLTFSHSRHIHSNDLKNLEINVFDLETDPKLQDLVLSVHHSSIITMTQTKTIKIIENQDGKAFIQLSN
jgi:hypothetical protein